MSTTETVEYVMGIRKFPKGKSYDVPIPKWWGDAPGRCELSTQKMKDFLREVRKNALS